MKDFLSIIFSPITFILGICAAILLYIIQVAGNLLLLVLFFGLPLYLMSLVSTYINSIDFHYVPNWLLILFYLFLFFGLVYLNLKILEKIPLLKRLTKE